MKKITIFTPSYNRGYTLDKLYKSLTQQTSKNFIWLIVDDGSTDNTYDLVQTWIKDNLIQIEYHKQSNQGKSMAHNKGVSLTKTDLFTCVDSDDFLAKDAVRNILLEWEKQSKTRRVIGILAYKVYYDGSSITTLRNNDVKYSTLNNAYKKFGLKGDTMLIYLTEIISKYKFPDFPGEKFVPEAYLYDLIDQEGELLIFRGELYYCEYLEDGYTKNISQLLVNNPEGYLAFINQRLCFDKKLSDKVLDTIRYTSMCIHSQRKSKIYNSVYPMICLVTLPLAYIFYYKKYRHIKMKHDS